MKRREFAIKSALTTAFAYSGSAYALFDPGKANDTINIGVIGTGDRGSRLINVIQEINR